MTHHTRLRFAARLLCTLALAGTIAPATARGQTTLRGHVIDSEMGHPLREASVRVQRAAPVISDSLGRFEVPDLTPGNATVSIQREGYALREFRIVLPESGVLEQVFTLDFTGYRLAEEVVRARVEELAPRYRDFELRRQRKLGAYFRWDELYRQGYSSVGDALRTVRGVRIRCNQERYECFAVMARTPQCQPTWWIDGVQVQSFHENTPIRDVYGIEIYRGPGEVPGEFAGSNAACGVIVMWTKSRPYRQ